MSGKTGIYIGTSGWSYPKGEGTWNGFFYPGGKINELEYYSQFFNTVEVNSSFYRPPDAGIVWNWVKRTPKDFLFTMKLWQKFTHPKMYEQATGQEAIIDQGDVDIFRKCLEPLAKAGKLGALLAQFPPSFKNDEKSRRILGGLANAFGEYNVAVELRHRSWSDDVNTKVFLKENNMAWVEIDEPRFADSIAAEVPVTSGTAYFRFHGRNAKEWWKGDGEQRYRYHYNETEIGELAERMKKAGREAKLMLAFFNNHWQAYAPRNANDLKKALDLPYIQIPMPLDLGVGGNDGENQGEK
jgi:uncharacterized protein YecE (DUF72 family)